jgi:hypothetical protein
MTISVTPALCSEDHVDVVYINAGGVLRRFIVQAWRHDTESDGPSVPITTIGPIVGMRYALRGNGADLNNYTLFDPGQPVTFTRYGECELNEFLGAR